MAISYPLSFPSTIGIGNIELYARHATAISRSPFTFQSQVQNYTGQIWGASIIIPPCKRDLAEEWVSFLLSLKGQYGTFLLVPPEGKEPRGSADEYTVEVDGGSQTGSTLDLVSKSGSGPSPSPVSVSGLFKKGDYIQIGSGSGSKLYKILEDVSTDGSGLATVEIFPNLRSSPSNEDPITVSNPAGVFRLSDNNVRWSVNDISSYGIQFDCEEAV